MLANYSSFFFLPFSTAKMTRIYHALHLTHNYFVLETTPLTQHRRGVISPPLCETLHQTELEKANKQEPNLPQKRFSTRGLATQG